MSKPAFSIYDASAGSGKTYTLVKEYLKIILLSKKQDAYRNILAITFTNKAVHEMKSRVVDSLSEFAKDNPSEKALSLMQVIHSETGISLFDIKEKAKSIIKNLIHNYAAFDISTIDKFTHKVIRAFAHDLNLPITFDVSLDTENLLTEAVDAIIAQAGEDETLTNLLVNFTMEKTDDDKSWDVSREIMETGKLILNENNREEISHFNNKSIAEFVEIKNKLEEYCQNLKSQSIDYSNLALRLIENKGIEFNSFYSSYVPKHFLKLSSGEIVKHIGHYKYLDENEGKRYSSKTPQNQKESIDEIADELFTILKQINEIAEKYLFYEAFLKNITPLSLMNTLSNKLHEIQKEQNILSIAEFNKLINEQIQNQPAPFIYERLGEKYKHFFIDEFQDTSEMQWQNLIPLIDNALSSEDLDGTRGSLMIVGDPKQSIYRWRGGKAEQFIELSKDKNPFVNPSKELFPLGINWRSYDQVIDFNNKFFKFLASKFANEDYKDLYENHSHQEFNDKKGGYVNVSFIPKIDKEEVSDEDSLDKNDLYLEATLNTILKVKSNGFNYKDIVILTRNKKPGTAIANHLIENGIPIVSSESLLLGASSEVQTCIYILRYLKNSNDLESKANFLYYLANNHQEKLPIHDFIAKGMELKNELEFQNWLTEIDVDFSFQNIRKKALYEATEIIISKVIPIEKRNAYVQYFLDLILEHDLKKQSGISDFLSYWENNSEKLSIPSPEGNDAVRIMTIHKSKGLEFPVVIFPFAEQNYSQNLGDKIWITADEEQIGLPKALVSKNKDVENFGEEASKVYNQKKEEDLLDNINVLYVALTRAEEQLYVISGLVAENSKGELPNNMATFFIEFLGNDFNEEQLEYEFGSNEKISKTKEAISNALTIPQLSETLNPKNIKIAQRESIMWNTKQQKAIEFGNIIHEILAFVKTKNDIDLAITKAIENGLIISSQKEEVLATLSEIVNHKELTDYFSEEHKVMNEQTIIQKQGNIVKPDRMSISKDKKVFLLDYKTGQHLPKHKTQLENYQKSIEDMGFEVEKKSLIYIGETIEVLHL
ncbi:UvrD-helicase domain-containing protein [Flavobacterium sp.]|uniref:UvrD-helicase domain-containing protein n=1 Tax=Flavobacterium sp. TaxID=239 RepID=UPI0026216BD7|nr:UvrD-helicase domain-containing protein [Flavobacterium sp.]